MPASFATQGTFTPDNFLIGGDSPTVSRQITLITGQNLTRGAVLGKITASGKYNLSLSAAADGSQVPVAVLAEDTDATAADKVTVAYMKAIVNENRLILGTGHTLASVREPLRDFGIYLQSSIT
jgi:hypothetical protein